MKKYILFFVSVLFLFASCDKTSYTVTGKYPSNESDGKIVYLQKLADDRKTMIVEDSTQIKDGIFTFKGKAPVAEMRFITVGDGAEINSMPFVIEGGKVNLDFYVNDDPKSMLKSGTMLNDTYQAFLNGSRETESTNEYSRIVMCYIRDNIQNATGVYTVLDNLYIFDAEQLKEILPLLSPEVRDLEAVKKAEKRLPALEATSVGKNFTDLQGKTPEGKDCALSNYVGKGNYVLIDFWASWCPPCRKEIPELVKIYDKYKPQGFEIVGVTWDDNAEAWKKGIADLNITWPQISDLGGRKSELTRAYGISFIPQTVLIDKEGTIIERNMSAKELDAKLQKLLDTNNK